MKNRMGKGVILDHSRRICFPDISSILLAFISALIGIIMTSLFKLPLSLALVLVVSIVTSFLFLYLISINIRNLPVEIDQLIKSVHNIRIVEGNNVFREFKRLFGEAEKTIRIAGGGPLIGIDDDETYRFEEIEIYQRVLLESKKKKTDLIIERIQREPNASICWLQALEDLKNEFGEKLRIYYDNSSFPDFAVNVFDSSVVFIEVVESDYNKIIRKDGIREVSKALIIEDEKISKEIEAVFTSMIAHTDKFPSCNFKALQQKRENLQKNREDRVREYIDKQGPHKDIIEIQRILEIPDYRLIKNVLENNEKPGKVGAGTERGN